MERAPGSGRLKTPGSVQDLWAMFVKKARCSFSILLHLLPPASSNLHKLAMAGRQKKSCALNLTKYKNREGSITFFFISPKASKCFHTGLCTKRFKNVNRSWIEKMYIWVFIVEFFQVVFIFEIFLRKKIFRYFCILWYSFGNTHEIVKGGKEYSLWYIKRKKSQALMFVINF